jgi:hypothetical protein
MIQPKVTGYRQLTEAEAMLMNEVKAHAEATRMLIEKLNGIPSLDRRWISIGQTGLQQGFMALVRSIAQPTTF